MDIDVTGVDLVKLVKEAYNLSIPRGLGFLHFKAAELSNEEAEAIIQRSASSNHFAVSMDYVNGRACKFHVTKLNGKLFIGDSWYDHSDEDLKELLHRVGIGELTGSVVSPKRSIGSD